MAKRYNRKRKVRFRGRRKSPYKKSFPTPGQKFLKGASTALELGIRGAKLASMVASMVNVETKHFENFLNLNPGTVPVIDCLTNIPEGTDSDERIGRSIKSKQLTWRGTMVRNVAAAVTNIRMIIIVDKGVTGVDPLYPQILYDDGISGAHIQQLNTDNAMSRFVVLKDVTYTLHANRPAINFQGYKKLEHHVKYLGATANPVDRSQGQMYVLWVSDQSTDVPNVSMNFRYMYYDN